MPALLWGLLVLVLSGYPGNKIPQAPFFGFDKVVHIIMYWIFASTLLFGYEFSKQNQKTKLKNIISLGGFAIFFGGFMEILQHYIFINRSGNLYDFIANTLGVTIGVLIFPLMVKLLPFNK